MNDLTIFSINAIAIDIANEYYLKKYPTTCKNELLMFPPENNFDRGGMFGFISVARIAALVPYIIKIYLDKKSEFIPKIQEHIDLYINHESIKILQVVALMSASGRWYKPGTNPMVDLNSVYIDQTIVECKNKLETLGIASAETNEYALLLKQNDYLPTETYK